MKKTNKLKAQSHLALSVRLNQGQKYTENYTNTVSNRYSQSKEINAKMLNPVKTKLNFNTIDLIVQTGQAKANQLDNRNKERISVHNLGLSSLFLTYSCSWETAVGKRMI